MTYMHPIKPYSEEHRNYYEQRIDNLIQAFTKMMIYQQICYDLVDEGVITGMDLVKREIDKERGR